LHSSKKKIDIELDPKAIDIELDPKAIDIELDPKALGGAEHDEWNKWLASKTFNAVPANSKGHDPGNSRCRFWNVRYEADRSD
jgi:hypothetical protein